MEKIQSKSKMVNVKVQGKINFEPYTSQEKFINLIFKDQSLFKIDFY